MKYLHEKNICYRNIKPEYILYNQEIESIEINFQELFDVRDGFYRFNYQTPKDLCFYETKKKFNEESFNERDREVYGLGILVLKLCLGSKTVTDSFINHLDSKEIPELLMNSSYSKNLINFISSCMISNVKEWKTINSLLELIATKGNRLTLLRLPINN